MNAYNYVIYKYAFFIETYLSILLTYRGLSGFLLQQPQINGIPPPRWILDIAININLYKDLWFQEHLTGFICLKK